MPVDSFRTPRLTRLATCLALALPTLASAQDAAPDAATLDRVQVIGASRLLSRFPGAVDVVDGADLRNGQAQVNLSEALSRVPGVTVRNRGNYAQDLQVQSRGFGARSTFGIRGLELVVDGIETTLPLFRALVREKDIIDGNYHIHWLEQFLAKGGMDT